MALLLVKPICEFHATSLPYQTIMKKIFCVIALFAFIAFYWKSRDVIIEKYYDLTHSNEIVSSRDQIDKILSEINSIQYGELDDEYLNYTKSDDTLYKEMLVDLEYHQVKRKDLNKRLVGKHRIKDFVPRDKYYRRMLYSKEKNINIILNKELMYKILELKLELEKRDLDQHAMSINHGHRNPRVNEKVGGAKRSRHIKGEAADLNIKDIDKDGKATDEDKQIVLEILDKIVIGDEGGLGLYPGSLTVHLDVRGVRARWDSF